MRTPIAPRQEDINNEHGIFRVDPYAWIKDRDDPRTIPYLETENAYTEHTMAHTVTLRETLCQELVGAFMRIIRRSHHSLNRSHFRGYPTLLDRRWDRCHRSPRRSQ